MRRWIGGWAGVLVACACGGCASEANPLTSGLYGPCGADLECDAGLKCIQSRAAPDVFLCSRPCELSAKCPGAVAIGQCRALAECEQGCCELVNAWTSTDTVTCEGQTLVAVHSDGYCSPRP